MMSRKAFLAYLGALGMAYDFAKSVINDGPAWLEKAEKRGEIVEKELMKAFEAYQKDFPGEMKKLASTIETNVNTMTKEVGGQAEKFVTRFDFGKRGAVSEVVEDIQVNGNGAVASAAEVKESVINAVWAGYDEMNVKDIVAGLESLSPENLVKVREYEAETKNRITVLREIDARMQAMTV
jgi:transketolase